MWDATTGGTLAELTGHTGWVRVAVFSPHGRRVGTAAQDVTAWVWDAATGAIVAVLGEHTSWLTSANFSPDGTRIVTGSQDRTARVWDVATGVGLAGLKVHTDRVNSTAFSPDGTRVVTASNDNSARLWDVRQAPRPSDINLWIESLTGGALDAQGNFKPFSPAELEARRTRLYADAEWLTAYRAYRESIIKNAREQLAREAAEREAAPAEPAK